MPKRRPNRPRRPSPPPNPIDHLQQMLIDQFSSRMDSMLDQFLSGLLPLGKPTPPPKLFPDGYPRPKSTKPPKPQPPITLYSILQVHPEASQEVITGAWRSLCKLHHPDKIKGHERKMQEINAAYNVLSDPVKRKQYDQSLRSQQR